MKKNRVKEIITLVVAGAVIIVSVYFLWNMLFPKKSNVTTAPTNVNKDPITTQIDEKTYDKINSLSDYGQPALTGIGKSDLFAN